MRIELEESMSAPESYPSDASLIVRVRNKHIQVILDMQRDGQELDLPDADWERVFAAIERLKRARQAAADSESQTP